VRKLFLLAVVGGLALLVELLAPPFVERRLEDGIHERTRDVARVRAETDSFPLVTRLLATGEVRSVAIELVEVAGREIPFATIGYELHGVTLSRSALAAGRVRVEQIDRGVITAYLTEEGLSETFGREVQIDPGRIEVAARAAQLVLEVTGLGPQQLPVPADVLPCEPEAALEADRIVLRCTIHDVPPILLSP
jgi:hypothetical protein